MATRIKTDVDYRVLYGATHSIGSRVPFTTGDIVRVLNGNADMDGDVRAQRVSDGTSSYIHTRFLEEVVAPAAASAKVPGVFAVGDRVRYQNTNDPSHRSNGRVGRITSLSSTLGTSATVVWDDGRALSDSPWLRNLQHESTPARVKVRGVYAEGDRVEYVGSMTPRLFGKIGTVISSSGNGDLRVRFEGVTDVQGVMLVSIKHADAPTTTVAASFNDAFVVGNTIQFTLEGVDLTGDRLEVGCKSVTFRTLFPSIVNMDKEAKKITLEAEVTDVWGFPKISKHGVDISQSEAREYFKDIKIVKTAEPARPDVTVTIPADQADALRDLLGTMKPSVLSPLWRQLTDNPDVKSYTFNVSGAGNVNFTKATQ